MRPGVLAEVLEADDPHDVGRVLGVWLLAELVGKDEASGGLLKENSDVILWRS